MFENSTIWICIVVFVIYRIFFHPFTHTFTHQAHFDTLAGKAGNSRGSRPPYRCTKDVSLLLNGNLFEEVHNFIIPV